MTRFLYLLMAIMLCLPAMAQSDTSEENTEVQATTKKRSVFNRNDGNTFHDPEVTKTKFNGLSGGMMVHLGYQFGQGCGFPTPLSLQQENAEEAYLRSITYGIGGMLRVHLFNHMHIGSEGYMSTMPLKSQGDGSNIRTGWGGILCDYYITIGRCQFIAGGTVGGGAQRNLHVFSEEDSKIIGENFRETWDNIFTYGSQESNSTACYCKKNFFVLDPYVAVEYAVTNRIHLIVKLDYLLASHNREFLTPSGPRLYVGFMFGH